MSSSSWVRFLKSHSPLLNPAGWAWPESVTAFCARSTFSGTRSQIALTSTFSIASRSCSKLVPRPPTPIIPRRTCSLASNGTPIIVEFGSFGAPALRSGLRMSVAVRSPAPAIAVRFMKLRREISRESLSVAMWWPPSNCVPVRLTLVLHQSALSFTPMVANRKLRIVVLGTLLAWTNLSCTPGHRIWTYRWVLLPKCATSARFRCDSRLSNLRPISRPRLLPSSQAALRPPGPLRTGREGYPSPSSSPSNASFRGDAVSKREDTDDEPGHGTRDEVRRGSWHLSNHPARGRRSNGAASL